MESGGRNMAKTDVAINIFAKPFQTALSLLSLLDKSGTHAGKIWLQYEPVGSKYDYIDPYAILEYINMLGYEFETSQPKRWLDLEATTPEMLESYSTRECIRYEHAFEHSASDLLFIMHNDIMVFRDILGDMISNLGDAFAIGQIGQCWNCPAANAGLMRSLFNTEACTPETHCNFQLTHGQLCDLYKQARKENIFARPYDTDGFDGEFAIQPWPLPECRVNEWACLINLKLTRPLTIPHGDAWPPGAYRVCGAHNLDIGTPFFRAMYAKGLRARHFDVTKYIRHWVGTGNNTPLRYAHSEDRAKNLLKKHYPQFFTWLEKYMGKKIA